MTHTNTSRKLENFGSLMAEVLEIDISSLDAAGTENNVDPTLLDNIDSFHGHHIDGKGTGDFAIAGWNETSGALMVKNGTSDGAALNNAAVNDTKVVWTGTP